MKLERALMVLLTMASCTVTVHIRSRANVMSLEEGSPEMPGKVSIEQEDGSITHINVRAEAREEREAKSVITSQSDGDYTRAGCATNYQSFHLTDETGFCPKISTKWSNDPQSNINQSVLLYQSVPSIWYEIRTKGNGINEEWVTSYRLEYTHNNQEWIKYNEGEIITGNVDQNTVAVFKFPKPFIAWYMRIYPVSWHGYMSFRLEGINGIVPAWGRAIYSKAEGVKTSASSTQTPECSVDMEGMGIYGTSGWCPADGADPLTSWFQIEWPQPVEQRELRFSGHKERDEYMSKYTVNYSMDGVTWISKPSLNGINSHGSSQHRLWWDLPRFYAKYMRVIPVEFNARPTLRAEFYYKNQTEYDRVDALSTPQELSDNIDGMIAAIGTGAPVTYSSTNLNCAGGPHLNSPEAWCVETMKNPAMEYIQIKADKVREWTAIQTSGRRNADQWVTFYKVESSVDGTTFTKYKEGEDIEGNSDRNTRVVHILDPPIMALAIRVIPVKYQLWAAMRMEAYIKPDEVDTTDETTTYVDPRIEIMRKIKEFLKQFGLDITFTEQDINNYALKLNIA